jgi:hypothetical protein
MEKLKPPDEIYRNTRLVAALISKSSFIDSVLYYRSECAELMAKHNLTYREIMLKNSAKHLDKIVHLLTFTPKNNEKIECMELIVEALHLLKSELKGTIGELAFDLSF